MILRFLHWLFAPTSSRRIEPPPKEEVTETIVRKTPQTCPTAPVVEAAVIAAKKPRTKPKEVTRASKQVTRTPPIAPRHSPSVPVTKKKEESVSSGDASDIIIPTAVLSSFDFSTPDSSDSSSSSSSDFSGSGGDFGGGGSSSDY